MDLEKLIDMQREFDQRHGWGVDDVPSERRLDAIEREIVGLIGEVGELANLVKKARLNVDGSATAREAFDQVTNEAREELADIFIYLLRLFQLTEANVTEEYIRKLEMNNARFKQYEKNETSD